MAPKQKRPSPLDDPPSDSEEEDQQPSSQQRPNHEDDDDDDEEEEEETSSEEDDDEDEDEEQQQQQHQASSRAVQPASKNPPPQQPANSHPKPSSSDTESESATESDSEPDPPPPKAKPLASAKPSNKDQTPKLKPHSSPAVQAKTTSSKRPAENDNNGPSNDPKRAKKKAPEPDDAPSDDEDPKKSPRDDSKKLFQRLFSTEDEIAILKGMAEFTSKTRGKDPFKCAEEFHDFMRRSKSLSFDASCNQLREKIRRLKKKFENNAGRGKNGEGPRFTRPHEKESFELSKKVWGSEEGNGEVEKAKPERSTPKKESNSAKSSVKPKPKPKPEAKSKPNSEPQLALADPKESGKAEEKSETNLALTSMIRLDRVVGLCGLGEDFVRERVGSIEASKREELEGKWRKLQDAELELFVKRAELYAEQARLMLQANKSSKN